MSRRELAERACVPCEGGIDPLPEARVARLLPQVPGWSLVDGGRALRRRFAFPDFHRLMGFVNALAWVASRQGHHPDFTVSHYDCAVTWTTHAIGGLSENDFICAARIDALAAANAAVRGARAA